jgi:drug/metabolite transporter (DMT)-like permease
MNLSIKVKSYWALVFISLFWGTTWFVSKLIIQFIPPLQLTGYRQTLAGLCLIAFHYHKHRLWPTKKEFGMHLLLGFLFFTCSNGLTTFAIKYIPSYLGALIGCLMPFVLILFNFFVYKEKVKPIVIFALGIGFTGIAIILLSFVEDIALGGNFLFGVLITLLSVFTWTSGTVISMRSKLNANPFQGIGWQMLFGGIMLYISSLMWENQVPIAQIPAKAWLYFTYLVAVGSIFCFVCYLFALKHLPMSLVSIYVYINPMVALFLGMLLLHEVFTPQIFIGVLITFLGIYLVKKFGK